MKRKIFKLLVAFLALAAFQTNALAQSGGVGYDGTKAYCLDVYYNGATLGTQYPNSPIVPTDLIGGLYLDTDNKFKFRSTPGGLGEEGFYFSLENYKDGSNTDKMGVFYIRNYDRYNQGKLLEFGGNNDWELVQFTGSGVIAKDPVAISPAGGGYVSVRTASSSPTGGRLLLVRMLKDKANDQLYKDDLTMVTYDVFNADRTLYQPIFIQARAISSRWARWTDFKDSHVDFSKIVNHLYGNLVVDENGKSIENFKVVLTDLAASIPGVEGTPALSAAFPGNVELFSFIAPQAGGKLLSVSRKAALDTQDPGSISVYGGLLTLEDPKPARIGDISGAADTLGNQRFAIWIETDGSLTLYPYKAWNHVHGQPGTLVAPEINMCITQNDHEYNGAINVEKYFKINYAFAINNPAYVVGPSRLATNTIYADANFRFQDNTKYNFIPEKRYFYMEAKRAPLRNNNGGTLKLVLDAVRQWTSTGDIQTKLVLTEKETDEEFHSPAADDPYYKTPYDSLNLSAYWQFEEVYVSDLNSAYTVDEKGKGTNYLVGYRITNELGQILRYTSNDGYWNTLAHGTLGGVGVNAHNYQNTEYQAYLSDSAMATGPFSVAPDYIWKVIGIKDADNNTDFFLRNIGGAPLRDATATPFAPRFLTSRFDLAIDTAILKYGWGPLVPGDYSNLFPYAITGNVGRTTYYNSVSTFEFDQRRTFYPDGWSTSYGNFSGVDGVLQRDVVFYEELKQDQFRTEDVLTARAPFSSTPGVPFDFYDEYNNRPFGLELSLTQIAYPLDRDEKWVKHDSISVYGQQLWFNYDVDSLFNYMYKQGYYGITEAIGHRDLLSVDEYNRAIVKHNISQVDSADLIQFVLVDEDITTRLQGRGAGDGPLKDAVPGITNLCYDSIGNTYKWFYLKYGDKYLSLDVHAGATPTINRFGFTFNETLPQNATRFRFYQPMVVDKKLTNFILEAVVPEFYYTNERDAVTGKYRLDFTRGDANARRDYYISGAQQWGYTYYAVITTQSNMLKVTRDVTEATRWTPTGATVPVCEWGYIDNDYLADTRMFGAPLRAERWDREVSGDPNNGWTGDFISQTREGEGHFKYQKATENIEQGDIVTFTLVPATKLIPQSTGGIGYLYDSIIRPDGVKVPRVKTPGALNPQFQFKDAKRPVQLYYIRREVRKKDSSGNDIVERTFLTTTGQTIYSQSDIGNMPDGVDGGILSFEPARLNQVVKGASVYTQMFAIYSQLGTDADRDNFGNTECIITDSAFHFGLHTIYPLAAYRFQYKQNWMQSDTIEFNVNMGDYSVNEDYRVATTRPDELSSLSKQLYVAAGGTTGKPASEYVFSYVPYIGEFACPNFVDRYDYVYTNGIGRGTAVPYLCDGRTVNYFHRDYADPSQQWTVTRITENEATFDYYAYKFKPLTDSKGIYSRTRNQVPVEQTELLPNQYLFLVDDSSHVTAYGDTGYVRNLISVRQYKRVNGVYDFSEFFDDDIQTVQVTQITNKYIGEENKVDSVSRKYNGDSTIDYYFTFPMDDDVISYDWSVIESFYKDRFLFAREFSIPIKDSLQAYVDSTKAKYLSFRKSNYEWFGACDGGVRVHQIQYYNIVYTDPATDKEYFLEVDQKGKVAFVYLTDTEKNRLGNVESYPTYKPGMKFCFPYRMYRDLNVNTLNNRIEYVGENDLPNQENTPETNPYYDYGKVYIQSMATFNTLNEQNVNPLIVKITSTSTGVAGQQIGKLYDVDYRKDLGATTWFFGDSNSADNVWIELHQKEGWLRLAAFPESSDYLVIQSGNPVVNYGEVEFRESIMDENGNNNVDEAKLKFDLVAHRVLGKYDPKNIWYYNIINKDGLYLTSAHRETDSKYHVVGEPYAYFAPKKASDPYYTQMFGLKYIKPSDTSKPDPYEFWVVAGVDSTKNNTLASPYYYMSGINEILTFRHGGGTSQQVTEESALRFLFGDATNDGFTDIDDVDAGGVKIYAVENGVRIVGAAEGDDIKVYTLDGSLIKAQQATSGDMVISVPNGLVIVKVAAKYAKVLVK